MIISTIDMLIGAAVLFLAGICIVHLFGIEANASNIVYILLTAILFSSFAFFIKRCG